MNHAEESPPFDRVQLSNPRFEPDGLRHMTVHSRALRGRADVSLFVPQGLESYSSVPMVILLHGVYGSHWSWFLQGGAHLTARMLIEQQRIRPMLLVAPSDGLDGDGTAYLPSGERDYEAWICRDLIACLETQFCNPNQRAAIFIAGLSMGGYGALRLGAKYPRQFLGISAHSAITMPEDFQGFVRDTTPLRTFTPEELDPFHWLLLHRTDLPPLRFDCGEEDALFNANQTLHHKLAEHHIPHDFVAYPGGHDWSYWQTHVTDALLFFEDILRVNR